MVDWPDSTWQMERLYNNMVNMGNRILLARYLLARPTQACGAEQEKAKFCVKKKLKLKKTIAS